MKAYKVFNNDWTCRGFQYKVGETYEMGGLPKLCNRGFHACKRAVDCFKYYTFDPKNKVAEVELLGNVAGLEDYKQSTNKIRIVREIEWAELLNIVNSGNWNSGYVNSGNRNSGNRNSGYRNSGDCNSGNRNSGYRNSGDCNSGDCNSGYGNSGNWNSGDCNSGNWNSGYGNSGYRNSGDCNSGNWNSGNGNSGNWNSCDFETGFFNPKSKPVKKIRVFGSSFVGREEFISHKGVEICRRLKPIYYRRNGKKIEMPYKCWWDCWAAGLTRDDKQAVKNMAGFDSEVFYEITGLDWRIKAEKC